MPHRLYKPNWEKSYQKYFSLTLSGHCSYLSLTLWFSFFSFCRESYFGTNRNETVVVPHDISAWQAVMIKVHWLQSRHFVVRSGNPTKAKHFAAIGHHLRVYSLRGESCTPFLKQPMHFITFAPGTQHDADCKRNIPQEHSWSFIPIELTSINFNFDSPLDCWNAIAGVVIRFLPIHSIWVMWCIQSRRKKDHFLNWKFCCRSGNIMNVSVEVRLQPTNH